MPLIKYSVDTYGVAQVILDRPEKMNAFSRALCDEYLEVLLDIENKISETRIRVVILDTSSDKAFCAGADLKEREAMNEVQISEQLSVQRQMMDRTASLQVPTIAAVRGIAFGGGLELALACDFRIAAPGAQLGLTELRLGIIPGSGGTQRLVRLIGLAKAREMIQLAKRIDAQTAESMGLVNVVSSDVTGTLETYIEAILCTAPLAQRAAKRALNEGVDMALSDGLDFERQNYATVLRSQDRVEGIQAFLQKRNPKYRGV